jgi:hypothetical protein
VLAGDLVAAGYAVRVDGKQDAHAVPGSGTDLGGRGAGGQPQRQRGMAEAVGAAGRLVPVPSSGMAAAPACPLVIPVHLAAPATSSRAGHRPAAVAPGPRSRPPGLSRRR